MALSVSVALCTYNGSRFIEQQLASILSQTVLPGEIVVADDGSTDGTLDKVRALADDSPVPITILIGDVPLGVARNFQRAIQACSGDLVALSDQDDVWHSNRLTDAISSFESDDRLLLHHSDARLVDEDGTSLDHGLFQALKIRRGELAMITAGRTFEAYIRRNLATGATVVFRRSLMEDAAPFPASWVHDEWLAIVAAATGKVHLHNAQLIDYRQHGNNQIGVRKPTLRYRAGRMLGQRGNRYEELAVRSQALVERLQELDVDPATLRLAREKARFEAVRATLPRRRLARVGTVVAEYRRGSYRLLSSQGDLDVVRDLLQPV